MALPQHFVFGRGGTLIADLPVRPQIVPPTVTVRGPDNVAYVTAAAAVLEAVNTFLTASVLARATAMTLAVGTNTAAHRSYRLSHATSREPIEWVRLRTTNPATGAVALVARLKYAHTGGAATDTLFQSTRLSYFVTAAQATAMFRRGRVEWNWSSDGATLNEQFVQSVGCTRYSIANAFLPPDLDAIDPGWFEKTDEYLDIEELRARAFNLVLERMSGHLDPHDAVGMDTFREATAWQAFVLMADRYGAAFTPERERYEANLDRAVRVARRVHPFDVDRDQVIRRPHEVGFLERPKFIG